ncbi:MAG TPA: glycine oxidase maturase GoxB [Alphaproteobacteria bacterium]|nr:glycine oxidase maturase GoxB [Alphaproteobacteria bacterium]
MTRRPGVAVLGGGVAAAAALLTLAELDVPACGIAPPSRAGERDRPGESLSPKALPILAELGLAERFAALPQRPAHATYAAWSTSFLAERNAFASPDGPGLVIDRPAFDRMLEAALEVRGVDRVAGEIVEVERHGTGWRIARADGAALEADFVIDCTGARAVAARRLVQRRRADRLVAAVAFLDQIDATVEPTNATLIEAAEQGWWYATLLPDGRLALAYFTDPDFMPRNLARDLGAWRGLVGATQFMARWIESARFALDEPPRHASAGTVWLERSAGEGWAAAGDAAAAFDPLSSHGITTALWAGRRAALAAAAWLGGDRVPLDAYGATLAEAVEAFLRERTLVYGKSRFRAAPFWRRRCAVPEMSELARATPR